MSRDIILFIATSLDGFIAKEDDDLQWLFETEGEGDNGYLEKCINLSIQRLWGKTPMIM